MKYRIREDISRTFQHPAIGRDVTVYRIEALKDFDTIVDRRVRTGDLGVC
jgi:hypothetical protein